VLPKSRKSKLSFNDDVDTIIMTTCCCSPCRPTYKRHVDGIYPAAAEDGLVKNKMESLVYFAMTSPEKLDRIGEYLAYRISRDIIRSRRELVFIGVEAIDQLLQSACHVRTLNLFVESFLKTIQKLLESPDPDLQILASASFLRFSKIEEETPSYHRSYDFFISRFTQMCLSSHSDVEGTRKRLRISGLEGLLGVIRKTVNEDLAENIWEAKHMDKIIASLLFNLDINDVGIAMESEDGGGPVGRATPDPLGNGRASTASDKADQILRELVNCASCISDIKAIMLPVLRHMDEQRVWVQSPMEAVYTFDAIMYSIQADLSYVVIEQILVHLESMANIAGKSMVADALARIIGIGVGDSTVGPAVLEIINALLKHLEKSVALGRKYEEPGSRAMQCYQAALLRGLGEYTAKMPDFQKTENMTFILSKIPMDHHRSGSGAIDTDVQHVFMKALFSVAEKHTSNLFSSTFSTGLLHSLLRLLQASDSDVRLLVLQTFQILVDRHGNIEKLSVPTISPGSLGLNGFPTKPNRADQLFVQKSVFRIYAGFKTVLLEQTNSKEFLDATYSTVALLSVETSGIDDSAVYLLDLIDSMQTAAIRELALSTENRFALHAVSIALLALLAIMVNVPEIDTYLESVISARQSKAPHMLPPLHEEYNPGLDPNTPDEDVVIMTEVVKEALKNAGKDVEGMDTLTRFHTANGGGRGGKMSPRSSWLPHEPRPILTSSTSVSRRPSTVSTISGGQIDAIDSCCSSPRVLRRLFSDEVSARALKSVLLTSAKEANETWERKKLKQDLFVDGTFEDICSVLERDEPYLHEHLATLFNVQLQVKNGSAVDTSPNVDDKSNCTMLAPKNSYSVMEDNEPHMKFCPQIFMY
jgi:hypothetical protein